MLTHEPAHFALIAAPDLQPVELTDVPTGIAALIRIHDEQWLAVAVCMPWRIGAPALPPNAAPGARTGPEQWHAVMDRLDAAVGYWVDLAVGSSD